ncbi:hypothetical protein BLOT_010153 [Blomia tropicalis]|nr:hypothetical protein BLOT_010153 [Blomia tropicalis]
MEIDFEPLCFCKSLELIDFKILVDYEKLTFSIAISIDGLAKSSVYGNSASRIKIATNRTSNGLPHHTTN